MLGDSADNSSSTVSDITAFNPSTVTTLETQTTDETRSGSSESNTPSTVIPGGEEVESSIRLVDETPAVHSGPESVSPGRETTVVLGKTKTTVIETTVPGNIPPSGTQENTDISVVTATYKTNQYQKNAKQDKKKPNRNPIKVYTANKLKSYWGARPSKSLVIATPKSQEEAELRELELQRTLARNRSNARQNRRMEQIDSEFYAQNSSLDFNQYVGLLESAGVQGGSLDARVKLAVHYAKNKNPAPVSGNPRETVSKVKPLQTQLTFAPMLENQRVIDPLEVSNTAINDADRIMQMGNQNLDTDELGDFPFGDDPIEVPAVSEILNENNPPPPFPNPPNTGGLDNYNLDYHAPLPSNTGAIKKTTQHANAIGRGDLKDTEVLTTAHMNMIIGAINELTHVTNDLTATVNSSGLQHKEYLDIFSRHTVSIEDLGSKMQLMQDEMAGVRQAIVSLERRFEEHLKVGQLQSSRPAAPVMSAHPAVSNPTPALKPIPPRYEEMIVWFLDKGGLPSTYKSVVSALLSYSDVKDIRELAKKTGLPISESDIQFLAGFELRDRQREKIRIICWIWLSDGGWECVTTLLRNNQHRESRWH